MAASFPIQVTFHGMQSSPAIEAEIRERSEALARLFDGVLGVRVILDQKKRREHQRGLYYARLKIATPHGLVVVGRSPQDRAAHEDPYHALKQAFEAAERQRRPRR